MRVIVGETEPSPASANDTPPAEVIVIEANLDDMNPEGYDLTVQRLFDAGALDVTLTPVQMKKGRPGVTLYVIGPIEGEAALVDLILRETTTFGVRTSPWRRHTLERTYRTVETPFGPVKVKIGIRNSDIYSASP